MTAYGVYIHQDIEAVLTETFVMTFRRVKSQDALEACLLLTLFLRKQSGFLFVSANRRHF